MNAFFILFIAAGAVILLWMMKARRPGTALLSAAFGAAALLAANLLSAFIPLSMPLNTFTLFVSAIGGIPGVILLHLMFAIF